MDPIKDAFSRIKDDIFYLFDQISTIRMELDELKRTLFNMTQQIELQSTTIQQLKETAPQFPTNNLSLESPKPSNIDISTGNKGVPTDRQTDRQTDKKPQISQKIEFLSHFNTKKRQNIDHLERVSEVLNSLDSLKKDLRIKFKKLTNQEMLVFSTIYQLEEEGFVVDYPLVSKKLKLSESSIRDYTQRIIKKNIPLMKIKQNNKKITLSILPELKKIASIDTILTLREL